MPSRGMATVSTSTRTRTARLLERAAQIAADELPTPSGEFGVIPGRRLGRLAGLYATKIHWRRLIGAEDAGRRFIIHRTGLMDRRDARLILRLVGSARRLTFIGDLDPADFVCLLSLRHHLPSVHIPMATSAWYGLAVLSLKREQTLPTLAMSKAEFAIWEEIRELAPEFTKTLSAPMVQMLDAGAKLELEGLVNPWFYKEPYVAHVRAYL